MNIIQAINMTKIKLKAYKTVGLALLAGLTAVLTIFAFLNIFFLFNTNWTAPTILTVTNDKMLSFLGGYESAVQGLTTSKVIRDQAEREYQIAVKNYNNLQQLAVKFKGFKQTSDSLADVKLRDINASEHLQDSLNGVAKDTNRSVQSGLITKVDAAQALAAIQQFNNALTDSKVSFETTGITNSTANVTLQNQLLQAESDVKTKRAMADAANTNYGVADEVMKIIVDTAYFRTLKQHASNLSFVAYNNHDAKIGSPIYDCYLLVIACHKVGVVSHVYPDEVTIAFPIFNVRFSSEIRGHMVEMDIAKDSAESQLLFIGHKPLLF